MPRKNRKPLLKQLLIVGCVLAALQVGLLVFWSQKQGPLTASEAIDKAVRSIPDAREREQARVLMAVRGYQARHGALPAKLDDLVPLYLDKIPLDPNTNEPFDYRVDGERFYVGRTESPPAAPQGGATPASGASTAVAAVLAPEDLQTLEEDPQKLAFVYDPTGKRDPFAAFDMSVESPKCKKSDPLACFDLGQLKLTAVLKGFAEPQAIVEAGAGKGYTVKKGMKIGRAGGEIVEILPDRLVILETTQDFTGSKKTSTVELRLRTKDDEEASTQGSE